MRENYDIAWIHTDINEKHMTLILSIIGGMFGVDRAYKGSLFLALIKTITLGGLFFWYILDIWYSASTASNTMNRYKEYLKKQRNH